MTFDEMVQEVYTLTNRPDMVQQTKLALRAATLKMHSVDFFNLDIWTTKIVFPETSFVQQLDTGLFQRYRAAAFARLWDDSLSAAQLNIFAIPQQPTDNQYNYFFKFISPEEIFDSYRTLRGNVAYAAGNVINLRARVGFNCIMHGFYSLPDVAEGSYSSWIAEKQPYAIIYDATSRILQTVGQNEVARKYDDPRTGLVPEQIAILKNSYVLSFGY
jgi:hypothetical protein